MGTNNILEILDLCKSFGGIQALNQATFRVKRGTIHALVGENGAGKTTFIKILTGIYRHDSGVVRYEGEEKDYKNPISARLDGISVVHQDFQLAAPLSIVENMFIGRMLHKKSGLLDWKSMERQAQKLLNDFNVDRNVRDVISDLTVAEQQVVEICKALLWNCKLLLLDEPSATLTNREIELLFDLVKKLKASGITIIYISHRLEEVFRLADEVTVLCDGAVVGTEPITNLNRSTLIEMMVGREIGEEYPKLSIPIGDSSLVVKNLNRGESVVDVSFEARKGEVLGFAGLVGAGRTEIAKAILGINKRDSGEIILEGKQIENRSFAEAIRNGFGLLPEDRKLQGLITDFTIRENISMVAIDKISHNGIINKLKQIEVANGYVKSLSIATDSIEKEVQFLSGGNQQKVVIAKWLFENSNVMFLDEPTRGVDVGAKTEIYKLISEMASAGKIVIMISSDLPEILGMCDRILVINQGRLVAEMLQNEATQAKILSYCT